MQGKLKKCPKTVLCKECTYVQKYTNENDEKIDSTEDNEHTFSLSIFQERPVFTVETNGERLNEINLDRVQKKGDKISSQGYYKDITLQYKKRKAKLPKIASPDMMDTCEEVDKNKNMMREKRQNAHMTLPLLRWRKV